MNHSLGKENSCPPLNFQARTRFRPRLMVLEDRTVPAVVAWDGGGLTNNYTEAANWVGDVLPGVNDTSLFDNTSAKACVVNSDVAVGSLTAEASYGGNIQINEELTVINSATLRGSAIGGSGTFTLQGGTFTWTGGSLGCGVILGAATTTTVSGTGDAILSGDLLNQGDFTVDRRELTFSGGTLTNAEGATFTLNGAATLGDAGGDSLFVNRGEFKGKKHPGAFHREGTVKVDFTNTGEGVISTDGNIGLTFRDGVLKQEGDDAKLLPNNRSIFIQHWELLGGLIQGPGSVTVGTVDDTGTATWTWQNGSFLDIGTAVVKSNAVASFEFIHNVREPDKALERTFLLNEGTINLAANESYYNLQNSTLSNTGTIHFTGDQIRVVGNAPSRLINSGTVIKNVGLGFSSISVDFHNYGTVQTQAGTLKIQSGGHSTGGFHTNLNASLLFTNAVEFLWKEGTALSGNGTVAVEFSGKVKLDDNVTVRVPGTFRLEGLLHGKGNFSAGRFEWKEGDIGDAGSGTNVTVGVADTFAISYPTVPPPDKPIPIKNLTESTLTIRGSASFRGLAGLKLQTGNMAPASIVIDGAQANFVIGTNSNITSTLPGGVADTSIVIKNQGKLIKEEGLDPVEIEPTVEMNGGKVQGSGLKLKKLKTTGPGGQLIGDIEVGALSVEGGTLALGNWTLNVTGTATATSGTIDLQYGSLSAAGGVFLSGSSVLQGTGIVGGNLTNAATVLLTSDTPGPQLLVYGDYTQTASGTLSVKVGSSSGYGPISGRLVVYGSADLAGTVSVLPLPNSDSPYFGDRFRILDCSTRTGSTPLTLTGASLGHAELRLDESPFGLDLVATTWLDNFNGPDLEWTPDTAGTPATITQQNGRVEFRGSSSTLTKASIEQRTNMDGDFALAVDITQNGTGTSWRHGVVLNFGEEAIRFTNGGDGEWRIEYSWGTTQYTLFSGSGGGSAGGPETLKVRRQGGSLVFSVVRGGVETTITSLDAPTDWLFGVELIGEASNAPLNLDIDNFRLLGL